MRARGEAGPVSFEVRRGATTSLEVLEGAAFDYQDERAVLDAKRQA